MGWLIVLSIWRSYMAVSPYRRHKDDFAIPAPDHIALVDNLMIQLDLPLVPDTNHGSFSLVEDHLLMESCAECAAHWAKVTESGK
jgi:hypothetical protein